MSYRITSRTDPTRWFDHNGTDWTADPETTRVLTQPGYTFPLTPTGPIATLSDDSTLYAAALYVIPASDEQGDYPPYPKVPRSKGTVY